MSASRRMPCATATLCFCVSAVLACTGCGTVLEEYVSDLSLFPDASSISDSVRTACDGVMTEQQILTSIVAARIDRGNGYTKAEEEQTAFRNCTVDALLSEVDQDACVACKQAILDQVFGD